MSYIFLLLRFLILKESTFETSEKAFYINSKALFVLETFIFQNRKFHYVMESSVKKKICVLLYNFGSKHSLVKKLSKYFTKKCDLETSSRRFCVKKEVGSTFTGKRNF